MEYIGYAPINQLRYLGFAYGLNPYAFDPQITVSSLERNSAPFKEGEALAENQLRRLPLKLRVKIALAIILRQRKLVETRITSWPDHENDPLQGSTNADWRPAFWK